VSDNINASSENIIASGFPPYCFPETTYGHVQHATNREQISAANSSNDISNRLSESIDTLGSLWGRGNFTPPQLQHKLVNCCCPSRVNSEYSKLNGLHYSSRAEKKSINNKDV
jgi:hypothetical protein